MFDRVKNIFKSEKSVLHEVFISYSTLDKEWADDVCNVLESNGFKCWIAPRDLVPGENYVEAIFEAIKSAKVLVVVFSRHSNESKYVVHEVSAAFDHHVKVIPLKIDDSMPSDKMEFFLSRIMWIDAYHDKANAFELLVDAIRRLLRD